MWSLPGGPTSDPVRHRPPHDFGCRLRSTSPRWLVGFLTGLLLGGLVAWWAGAVFDDPLDRGWTFGPWARLWGGVALLIGVGIGARGTFGDVLLALVTGLLAVGTWWVIVVYRAPPWTLEGAWLYPLAIVSTVVAVWAARQAS